MVDVLVMSNVPSAFCSTRKLFLLVKYIFLIFIPLIRVAVGLNRFLNSGYTCAILHSEKTMLLLKISFLYALMRILASKVVTPMWRS